MNLSIAIAQLNPVVGDVTGNLAIVRRARDHLARDLPLFQESIVLTRWPHENGSLVCEGADDGSDPVESLLSRTRHVKRNVKRGAVGRRCCCGWPLVSSKP